MSGKEPNAPELFKIKGYKYRAKMLLAAAVLLIAVILILSLIIHGIASAVRGSANNDTDTNTDTEVSASITESDLVSEPEIDSSDTSSTENVSAEDTDSDNVREEKFDADGKLIIDTDTLDGKKAIAITFDDGPSEYTAELIEGLNERGARATFFIVGNCVEQYPETLSMMTAGGHQLGNHTYNHIDIAAAGAATANSEISKTDDAIFNACGERSTAFRPPYGSFTEANTKEINKTFTVWSLDTVDWKSRDAKKVKNTIISQSRDGSVVLLHDLYKSSVDGALAAIDELQSQGFVFVTVDELFTRYGYPISKTAHSAQYAVYETNSPHASEYIADMERDKAKDEASAAAGTFYYDRADSTDSAASDSSAYTSDEQYTRDNDSIRIIDSPTDTDHPLVY